MMSKQTRADFRRFLKTGGYCIPPGKTACALAKARTLEEWRIAESAGLVRLRAEPEQENYFDVYGEPEGYERANGGRVSAKQERKKIVDMLERDGAWVVISEYFDGEEWQHADSIGMCTGYADPLSPFCNDYVPDLMNAALAKIGQPGEH